MDPILAVGTSVSASVSFRSPQNSTQRSREQAPREQSTSDDSSSGNTGSESQSDPIPDIAEITGKRTAQIAEGILFSSELLIEQANRIQARTGGNQSNPVSSSLSSQIQEGSTFSLSVELQSLIQIVRQFSPDKESFERFAGRLSAYLSGNSGQEQSFEEFLGEVSGQFGFSIEIQQSMQFNSREQIVIRNGDETRTIERISNAQVQSGAVQEAEPLVFDLDGDGLELTTVEEGVQFDIQGNGQTVQTAFVTGDDAFLALDRNGNGTIDSGKELFGDQHGAQNGIEELRKFDENQDGVINQSDSVFDDLRLFIDRNGDGYSQQNELRKLSEEDITEISLDAKEENRRIAGNRLAASTTYQRSDGSRNQVGELYLNFIA